MARSDSLDQKTWMADFETTTDPDDCRVWAWGCAAVFHAEDIWDVHTGTDIESFFDFCRGYNMYVYFHNLAFDGTFIMDALFRMGFRHQRTRRLQPKQFMTLISDRSVVYSITVKWEDGTTTEFRDSYKKLPMTVERMAKAFELPMEKGEIDYDAPRPVGHRLTMEERSYLCRDVLIVAKALRFQLEAGMRKLTVGSDALHEYKGMAGPKVFTRMFPVLPEQLDFRVRRAYRGGWTYKDKRRLATAIQGRGIVLDVNSLYPSVMRYRPLPFGEPVVLRGVPKATELHPLFITSITFTAKLKPDHLPCIQVKSNFMFDGSEYVEEIPEPVTLVVTNVDLALWQEQYDMDILAYNWSYGFMAATGMFDEYIDHWSAVKANSTGGKRELAKLMLNSLYGKFATNPDVTQRFPVLEDGVVKLRNGPQETRDPVYTPVGVFTTSYARDVTIRAAQANYATFAYADTDSLHLLQDEPPENLEVHPTKLGAWKLEYSFASARFIRAKQYIEKLDDGSHVVHIAGLSRNVATRVTLDNDQILYTEKRKDGTDGQTHVAGPEGIRLPSLKAKRVPGGIVLQDVGFVLKLC